MFHVIVEAKTFGITGAFMDLSPRVITLGTAGGPRWWGAPSTGRRRNGIATAVVVGTAVYLVDCGRGASGQFAEAGLDYRHAFGLTDLGLA